MNTDKQTTTTASAQPEKVCPTCKGDGLDKAHTWPDGSFASCETCEGYGTFSEIGDQAKEEIENLIRSYAVRDILDFMSDAILRNCDEIGYEPNEQCARDDAAIIAHAAKHVKG